MENKSHAIAAGVFVLSLVVVLAFLAVWLTRDQGSYNTYELSTPQAVTGLQPQAPVRYKGVAVGRVSYIGFDKDEPGHVLIRVLVDDTTPVTETTFATLGYQGVTGLAYIDLDDAKESLRDLGRTSRGYRRLPMRQSNLSQLAAMGPELFGEVQETLTRVKTLLSDDNQRVLIGTVSSFGQAAHNTSVLVEQLNQSWNKDLAPAITQLSGDVQRNMASLEKTAHSISLMSREIAAVAKQVGQEGGAVDQLSVTAQSFEGVANDINSNTLPRLQSTMDEVSAAMREVKQLASGLSESPQAFIFGPNVGQPGPGEPGFVAPVGH
ncbi:MCE family protein [Lampropedia puyangensis]|uniref:MCE family protein n=1 Tax=Lampropedia puyangensis TaxID=1330072 RepID=A0A4S8FI85_9BURK|nr:MlaD family protein [Lampropedia puyangensis]THU05382.1 MCE family protein [Lampropedia puyangensis]